MKRILYFYGECCPMCKALKPNFEAEIKRIGFTNYSYVNTDESENDKTVARYRVRSIPTLIFIEDNEEIGRAIGPTAWERIKNFIP